MSEMLKDVFAMRWVFTYGSAKGGSLLYEEFKNRLESLPEQAHACVDEAMRTRIEEHAGMAPREYIALAHNIHIEPHSGWAIQGTRLLKESLIDVYAHHQRLRRPSFLRYASKRLGPSNIRVLDSAICFFQSPWNYWHFYNNFLYNLLLFDQLGLLRGTPVVIPPLLGSCRFFKYVASHIKPFMSMNFIYQEAGEVIKVKSAFLSGSGWGVPENLTKPAALVKQQVCIAPLKKQKLFITRRKASRQPKNLDQLEQFAERHGYNVFDCALLSLPQQIELFSSATAIVALHGASLANLAFATSSCKFLIEISPVSHVNPCYYWLTAHLGILYSSMIYRKDIVDAVELCQRITEMEKLTS